MPNGDGEKRSDYKTLGKLEANVENILDVCRKNSEWMEKHSGEGEGTTHYNQDKKISSNSKKLNWILGIGSLGAFLLSLKAGIGGWVRSLFGGNG